LAAVKAHMDYEIVLIYYYLYIRGNTACRRPFEKMTAIIPVFQRKTEKYGGIVN